VPPASDAFGGGVGGVELRAGDFPTFAFFAEAAAAGIATFFVPPLDGTYTPRGMVGPRKKSTTIRRFGFNLRCRRNNNLMQRTLLRSYKLKQQIRIKKM
jgi:hypothetical protein